MKANKPGLLKRKGSFAFFVLIMLVFSMPTQSNEYDRSAFGIAEPTHTEPVQSYIPKMRIHFIDVGQGDCTFIELPDDRTILVDAGNTDDDLSVTRYLDRMNVKHIDYLILTHLHCDHIGAADSVVLNYKVGELVFSEASIPAEANTQTYRDLKNAVDATNTDVSTMGAGDWITGNRITGNWIAGNLDAGKVMRLQISFLAPDGNRCEDENDESAVVKVSYGSVSLLLTGDAGISSESDMLERGCNLDSDILKVPHHGSADSLSVKFLNAVSPKIAVISSGAGNEYGHPHESVLKALVSVGAKVLRTDCSGTIVISTDGKRICLL